jgi:hypothetical protein
LPVTKDEARRIADGTHAAWNFHGAGLHFVRSRGVPATLCHISTVIMAPLVAHPRLPLTTWFWAAHLMTTHSNGMSARQLEQGDEARLTRFLA